MIEILYFLVTSKNLIGYSAILIASKLKKGK